MSEHFTFDVFLSHSSKDKAIVRDVAERLRQDGLKVWFDEWELKPGDSIPSKIEEGLEQSRVLVLCMSANAFGSDWAQLEAGTFRFRDPLNKDRRFIPLRLDDADIKGSLAQFLYIDWRTEEKRKQDFMRLVEACRPAQTQPTSGEQVAPLQLDKGVLSLGHTGRVLSVSWSPDGKYVLSGAYDNTVRLWEVTSGRCLRVLDGHSGSVSSVSWSPDGEYVLSGAYDNTVRLWEVSSGRCLRVFNGHTGRVLTVSWGPNGEQALTGAEDRTVRLWEVSSGRCLRVLEGHTGGVLTVSWSPNGEQALTGAEDRTVRLWEVSSGRCLRVLRGHTGSVWSVSWSPDGGRAYSGSSDSTVRLWEISSGRYVRVLRGHTGSVLSVSCSLDGRHVLSGSSDNTVRLWKVSSGKCVGVLKGHRGSVLSVSSSPDGEQAVSGAYDSTVRLWEVLSGRCVRVLEGHIGRVMSVSWSPNGEQALTGAEDSTVRLWEVPGGRCIDMFEGHTGRVWCVSWSPDGAYAFSGSSDSTVRLWEIPSSLCIRVFNGHTDSVWSVSCSPDGVYAVSGSSDKTIRLWEVSSGQCFRVFEGHTGTVWSVCWSLDGRHVLSGADDNTVRLWEVSSGRCLRVLEGHRGHVLSLSWSPDGENALSGASDNTVRLWEVSSGRCLRVLEGHKDSVLSVSWSPDGDFALSGAYDGTVRLWEVSSGRCLRVLEGHKDSVLSVSWSPDGLKANSADINGVMRIWDLREILDTAIAEGTVVLPGVKVSGRGYVVPPQILYTNAKVLLVGDSGVGKTGLSMRLASEKWEPSDSTVGAWATQWKLPVLGDDGVEREIWLWDFGGQADQRLIHQLFMDETTMAVLVFDGQKEDLFETLGQWDRDLTRATRKEFAKLLVAGRVDAGGLRVSRSEIEKFAAERKFLGFLETSAKKNAGCEELKEAILSSINWDEIPCRTTEVLFKRLKEEIVRLKDEGRVLMRFNELRETLQLRLSGEFGRFADQELRAVLTLLTGPGMVWELAFGSWVLLQPERINAYAQAVIRTLQADEHQRGCLMEERVLQGDLAYESSMPRLAGDEERFVLLAMHQTLVERGLCLRQPTHKGNLLIFPSYYRRERPVQVGHPAVLVSYRFTGFLDEIYATLVTRLHHTEPFHQDQLWRYAADFRTNTGKGLGVKLTRHAAGVGALEVYFDPSVAIEEKIIFSKYVHEHLLQHARDVERLRHYVCSNCGTPVGNREVAMKRLNEWLRIQLPRSEAGSGFMLRRGEEKPPSIICVGCEKRVALWDEMEQCFASPEIQQRVRDMQEESKIVLDNESKERALVGEVISTVALAGQICREKSVSDHGIDMEIEFKEDDNEATGHMLFLQLKSGDSYLRDRKSDGAEIFTIKDERHARYWMAQAFPVMLVIRNSEGDVRWMEVRDWLKRASEDGAKPVKQILFKGERFDVMSVRRWRERILSGHGA